MFGWSACTGVNDGKLDPMAMKCIFLRYASKGKFHHLWCIEEENTQNFIIIIDVEGFSMHLYTKFK